MAINADSIAQIGDAGGDPVGSQAKALSIKDMMDREQLNSLQLKGAKADAESNAKIQALLKGENGGKGADYSTPEGVMRTAQKINQISPKAALEFQTTAQRYQSGQVQSQIDQYELLDHQQGVIVSAIDPIVAQARAMKNGGADDMTVNAYVQQQLPGALTQLRDTKLPNGQSALSPQVIQQVQEASKQGPMTLSTLEGFETKSKQGQAAIKQRLDQLKADTATKKENEGEREDRARDARDERRLDQGDRKITDNEQKIRDAHAQFDGRKGDLAAALAIKNVSPPAGFRSQAQMSALFDGLLRKYPNDSVDDIAERIRVGKIDLAAVMKETQVAAAQVGKVELAGNELDTFGDQVLAASKAVPRGNFVPFGKLMQMSDSAISDPALINFKAKMQALNNAYDQLAAREFHLAHVHELFETATGEAGVQALVKAVKEEAKAADEAAKRTMKVKGSGDVAQQNDPKGGAGATDHPADIQAILHKYGSAAPPGPQVASPAPQGGATNTAAADFADLRVKPGSAHSDESKWDKRADGSQKGHGFLGLLRRKDGGVSSEISVGTEINGKETDIPLMVPTLTRAEVEQLLNNPVGEHMKIPPAVFQKAVAFARTRIATGKSPFAQSDESPQ
jgi:hypothetical protein